MCALPRLAPGLPEDVPTQNASLGLQHHPNRLAVIVLRLVLTLPVTFAADL